MTAAWDPQLNRQAEATRTTTARPRCLSCGQACPVPSITLSGAVEIALGVFGIERDELLGYCPDPIATAARSLVVWALRTLGGPHSYGPIAAALERSRDEIVRLHTKAIALRLANATFAAACDRMAARHSAETEHSHG